jgi:signal transduction histidine kinase
MTGRTGIPVHQHATADTEPARLSGPAPARPAPAAPPEADPVPPGPAAGAFGTELLSKLSHELRSPLASIVGLTRVMLLRLSAGTAEAATQVRQLQLLQASAAMSLATIERVVDLARIESGLTGPLPQLVDCRSVVTDVAAKLGPAAAARGLRLRTDVPERPVLISTDPELLGRLLSELAGNALKFTDAGEVRIRLDASAESLVIEVSDDGPGIAPHEQARIFEPFERGELAAERDDGAAGLGLCLARKQAELIGAQLSLGRQAGPGATFSVTLDGPRTDPRS